MMVNLGKAYLCYARCIHFIFLFGTMVPSVCEIYNDAWTKVFETDVNGSVVMGNESELKAAVVMGAEVRFVIPAWGEAGYVGTFDFISAHTGYPCGQSLMHVSKGSWNKFPDDVYWMYIYVWTSGNVYQGFFDVGSNNFRSETSSVFAVQWFMRKPVSQFAVFSHLKYGTVVSGSKKDLINAVLNGYDIIAVMPNTWFLILRNVDISSTGEVVGQHIWQTILGSTNGYWLFSMWSTDGFIAMSSWTLDGNINMESVLYDAYLNWFVDPCWCEVYTHDENGNSEGSVNHLISAVEGGHRVKIVVGNLSIQVDSVRTKNGQVSAQLLDQLSKDDSHMFEVDLTRIWQMAHTTGTILTRRYFVSNFTNAGDTTERKVISWFIDTHTWTKVLSTGSRGTVRSGSKTELRDAIQNGAAVRVALQFRRGDRRGHGWFVMDANNLELSSSGEIAAQLIKSVSTEAAGHSEFRIKDDPSWRFMIVTTQGNVEISLWKVGDHVNDGRFSTNANVNWFVSY